MNSKIINLKDNLHVIESGATSSSFTSPHIFVKYVINYESFQVFEREKYISSILKQFSWYPKLLYCDDENKFFIYKNVGVPVNSTNKPDDLEEQFNKILADMEKVNVQHNDIKHGEILIDENKKIYLCDFGWASINNEIGCGINIYNKKKPYGCMDDKTALRRLNLITNNITSMDNFETSQTLPELYSNAIELLSTNPVQSFGLLSYLDQKLPNHTQIKNALLQCTIVLAKSVPNINSDNLPYVLEFNEEIIKKIWLPHNWEIILKHATAGNISNIINHISANQRFEYMETLPVIVPEIALINNLPIRMFYHDTIQINTLRKKFIESLEISPTTSLIDQHQSYNLNLLREITNPLYYICYQGKNDVTLLRKYYDYYKSRTRITDISLDIESLPSLKQESESRPIRIGFIQPYYDNNFHSVSRVCNGIIQRLVSKNDTDTTNIVYQLIHVPKLSNNKIQDESISHIKSQNFDIIVYLTLGTDLITDFLSNYRLAKIQCNFWGHINTSGKPTIDYYITSKHFHSSQEYFSETLHHMDSLGTYYTKEYEEYCKTILQPKFTTRESFGIHPDSFVCFYPHNLIKFHPDYDATIEMLVETIPDCVIVILRTKSLQHLEPLFLGRLSKRLKPSQLQMIKFIDTDNHLYTDPSSASTLLTSSTIPPSTVENTNPSLSISLQNYHNLMYLSDLVLESYPFGGCLTSFDAISWGKVMLSYSHRVVRAKFTRGFYEKMGITDLVFTSDVEVSDWVKSMVSDRSILTSAMRDITLHRDKLYCDESCIGEWESFFTQILSHT